MSTVSKRLFLGGVGARRRVDRLVNGIFVHPSVAPTAAPLGVSKGRQRKASAESRFFFPFFLFPFSHSGFTPFFIYFYFYLYFCFWFSCSFFFCVFGGLKVRGVLVVHTVGYYWSKPRRTAGRLARPSGT